MVKEFLKIGQYLTKLCVVVHFGFTFWPALYSTNPVRRMWYAENAVKTSSSISTRRYCDHASLFVGCLARLFVTLVISPKVQSSPIFDSNSNRPSDSIRFERDWPIRKFSNRIGRACSFAQSNDSNH